MSKKNSLIVIFIFILGFLLRIGNPSYASPVLYAMSDEASNYMSALYMLSQKTLVTKAAVYPPLGAYVILPFLLLSFLLSILTGQYNNIEDLKFFLITHEGYYLFIPRIIAGIFGSLTILIIYLISKELFQKKKQYYNLVYIFLCFIF